MSTIPSSTSSPIQAQNLPQPTEQAAANNQTPIEVVVVPDSLPEIPSSSSPQNNQVNTEALRRYEFQLMPGQYHEEGQQLRDLRATYDDLVSEESCKRPTVFWLGVISLIGGVAIPIFALLALPYIAIGCAATFFANYLLSWCLSNRLSTIHGEKKRISDEAHAIHARIGESGQRALALPERVAAYEGIDRRDLNRIFLLPQVIDRQAREVPNRYTLEALDLVGPNACTNARLEINHFDVFAQPKENIRAVKAHLDRHAHLWPSSISTS